jgi:N-acetylglucosaminyldiphosphoundecaprenol N-acetyl-beta-D-mannosaminyltransferase
MPNTSSNPIRVADLSDSVYVPRVPTKSISNAYAGATKTRTESLFEDNASQYIWNRPAPVDEMPTDSASTATEYPEIANPDIAYSDSKPPSAIEYLPVFDDGFSSVLEQKLAPEHSSQGSQFETWNDTVEHSTTSHPELLDLRAPFAPETHVDLRPSQEPLPVLATSQVWGIDYHAVTMDQTIDYMDQLVALRQTSVAITANLNYAMLCEKLPRLKAFTKRASLVLCDGMPSNWRSKLNAVKLPERVTGADLIYRLTERCAQRGYRVYFYGASEGVAEAAAKKLKAQYPRLMVAGVQCPPFRNCSSTEIQSQIARIKQAKPDVLYVALGQPKGEYWIEEHLNELNIPLSIQLGASFDFVAGNIIRSPKWMQRLSLEWLYRAMKDPRRLAPRYWSNIVFLLRAVRKEMIDSLSNSETPK